MKIIAEDVRRLSLESLRPYVRDNPEFYGPPGKEHYALLAYLGTLFRARSIIDIGTHRGDSAMALSMNDSNQIVSFDIADKVGPVKRFRSNVSFRLANLFDPEVREAHRGLLLGSALISIDVDPHNGVMEYELVTWLEEAGYDGIVVLDDIWYFKPMRDRLWSQIRRSYKLDVTPIGHWSGTGLVSFAEPLECDVIPGPGDTTNWSLVTGYFDLTKEPDATPELRARPPEHYLDEHAWGTLAAEHNLIVFTEPEYEEKIWQMRPRWLHPWTKVVTGTMDRFPLTKHRDTIIGNRRRSGACASDPRNTASYYLFCMARYAMVQEALVANPFGSTQFAWINICIERMGYRNLVHLTEALACQREKFSTCFIDYVDRRRLIEEPLGSFFGEGGCRTPRGACAGTTFCSGFFTGAYKPMQEVCKKMERAFERCLAEGYGHADEQLMALVYAESPGLFDWYIGDYQEMITNYARVRDRPEQPLRNLIDHSRKAGDGAVCGRAAALLLNSYLAGTCELSEAHLAELLDHWEWFSTLPFKDAAERIIT